MSRRKIIASVYVHHATDTMYAIDTESDKTYISLDGGELFKPHNENSTKVQRLYNFNCRTRITIGK